MGVHAILFYHIAGVYRSHNLSVIELSMEDVSKPVARSIPKPRPRPKEPPESKEIVRPQARVRQIPSLKPMKLDPVDADVPDSLAERISVPDLPQTPGVPMSAWKGGPPIDAAGGDFDTARDYLDLVRLRIEQNKKYPVRAKDRSQEGRTTVRFVISKDGSPLEVRVHRSSRNRLLDRAAIQAVRDAGPFPVPPRRHFAGNIPIELTIVFELT
jgi:protein TonB